MAEFWNPHRTARAKRKVVSAGHGRVSGCCACRVCRTHQPTAAESSAATASTTPAITCPPRRVARRGLGPGPGRAQRPRAPLHPLDPHHRDRAPARGQIPHPHRRRSWHCATAAQADSPPSPPWSRSLFPHAVVLGHGGRTKPVMPTSPRPHYPLDPPGASRSRVLNTAGHEAPGPRSGPG
jgi:hypothetical protein